jgi:threonine-phosphate decarboxylase
MKQNRSNPHGGNIYNASNTYGYSQQEILDFSANINPLGVPKKLYEVINSNIEKLVNYPDPDCTELRKSISEYLGVHEDSIIIGNGASEIIFLIFGELKPKKVLMPAPTFSEYAEAAERFGSEIKYFELKECDGFKLNVEQMMHEISDDIDAVMLCNPNNPTSRLEDSQELIGLIEFADSKGVTVIIDEAFIELTQNGNLNSVAGELNRHKNLFIIRAFTKLFAIPGLRLGYGLGDEELVREMWDKKIPWSVNTFACNMGIILSHEKEYLNMTKLWIQQEIRWFYEQLSSLPKLKVFYPQTNFVLLKILDENLNAALLKNRMAAKGILIRDASNFKGLNEKFFRLAIKDRKSNKIVINALKEVLNF